MSQPNRCPECGAELPSGALGGLCPKCLLGAGLESRAEPAREGSGSDAPTTPHSGTFVPPEAASLAAHFPHLEILELLGQGGMGAVYKARQPKLDRLVALKIIRPESADDPAFAERFNREARMLARLGHPHIVPVYDFGEVSLSEATAGAGPRTLYFFLMEYVDGTNLRQLLQTGELLPEQALAIVPQICEALQFAHDEGVVHRDIKPENILLDKRGRVKIADFGLAKLVASSPQEFTLTGTHQVMGTPRYMAPEQMEGSHAVDHRADIYSLGVVFYEMLTGEVPMGHFEAPSRKVEIDVRLDEVVLRSLAKEPQRRYQHASDVKTDVESISQTPVTGANAPSGVVEAAPRFSRKAVLGACAVALSVAAWIIGLVTGAIVFELQYRRFYADTRGGPPVQWWEYPIMLTFGVAFLSGLVAPFAATILGIVAMREIKDSNGRLVGLGLAFFDAVLFPVLVINAVILAVCFLPAAYIGIAAGMDEEAASVLLPLLLVALPVDILLIRWWWRAAVRDRQLIGSGTERGTGSLSHYEGNRRQSSGDESGREPERRYQHASDVKNEVESISQTSWRAPTPEIRREIPIDDAEIKAARQQVQFPVIGLLVMGIFALPLAGRAFLSRYGDQTLSENPQQLLLWLAYFLPPLATLVGAVKMLQLSSYRWSIAASVLVFLSPAVLEQSHAWWLWWLCVVIGICSLVVLSKPEVKRGFWLRKQTPPRNPERVDKQDKPEERSGAQPRVPKLIYVLGMLQVLLGLFVLTALGISLMFPAVEPDDEWLATNPVIRKGGELHAAAEPWISAGLAFLLLASGIWLLLGRSWGRTLALSYAAIQITWGIASWPLYAASLVSLARDVSPPFDAEESMAIANAASAMLFLCVSEIIYPLFVLIVLNRPPIRLALGRASGDDARSQPAAEPQTDVARLIANPAWGLIITGVISWVTIPLAFWIPFSETEKLNATQRAIFQISFGVIPLVVGTIVALAGFRMKRLEGYRLAMFAAVLPIVVLLLKLIGLSFGTLAIGPADLVGAPIGLWVLVVLTRSDVKAAFHRPRPQEQSGHVNSDLESSASERDELARFGDAPSKTEDFLLMNPRLPVSANWITVYAIVVRPLLWILVVWLGFLGIMSSLAGDRPESAIEHIVDVVAGFCGLVFVMIVAIGGVKLRALQHAGPRWIKIGLGLGFAFGLLMFIVHLTVVPWFVGPLRWAARYNPELLIAEGFTQEEIAALVADKMHPILIPDAISVFFVLLWLALDIAVFVWLWRNSRFLPLSDAKELPEPNPVEAAPAGPNSEKQRGTLGQAWDQWWAERDRWFTRGVLCVLLVVHIGCLAMFLTLRGGGGYDSGRASAWHHVGWPTPWFVYERGVEPNVAFRRTTNLLSWSILVAGVGMLAWYAFWRVQLVRDARNARFWQTIGSPTAVLIVWIIAGALFAGLGVRAADRLYQSMRAQVAPVESPPTAEATSS